MNAPYDSRDVGVRLLNTLYVESRRDQACEMIISIESQEHSRQ